VLRALKVLPEFKVQLALKAFKVLKEQLALKDHRGHKE
jgi:hypothetical protein